MEERIKWVCARWMKRAIEIVCVQVKDIGRLTSTRTSEGTWQVCVWQGDMTRVLDVSVCVWGGGERGRGLTKEVERLVYVLRRKDPAIS